MRYFILLLLLVTSGLFAQVPQTLSYQGVLTDQNGVIVPDNSYLLTFKMYDAPAGGNTLWEELQSVNVSRGLFEVILGETIPVNLPFSSQYYLGIAVAGGTEMVPRAKITSNAYSFISNSVTDNSISTVKIQNGAITQNKLAPGLSLPPGGTAGGDLSGTYPDPVVSKLSGRTLSTTAPTSGQVLSWNGTQWTPTTPASGGFGGAGTVNYITKVTAANTLGNSVLYELTPGYLELGDVANVNALLRTRSNSWGGMLMSDGEGQHSAAIAYYHPGDYLQFELRNGAFVETKLRLHNNGKLQLGSGSSIKPNPGLLNVYSNYRHAGYFTSDSLSNLTNIVRSEYNGASGNADVIGFGSSVITNPGYGFGGEFTGGYIGARAFANATTYIGSAYGIVGAASGTAGSRYGVYGSTSGTAAARYGVYASGDLGYSGALIGPSDMRLKTNVSSMGSVLDKIMQVEPKYYEYTKDPQYAHMNLSSGMHYGFIAQELEKVFPEMVVTAIHPSVEETRGERGGEPLSYKGVATLEMVPVLLQAIKEQQQIIENLQQRIEQLERK